MHIRNSRTLILLSLVAASTMFAGCGDESSHLPIGSVSLASNSSALQTQTDDPVLAGYDGIDTMDSESADSLWGQAANDFSNDSTALNVGLDDDLGFDDGLEPVGYGYGNGYNDGLGYGYGGFNSGWGSSLGLGASAAALPMDSFNTGFVNDATMIDDIGFDDMGGSLDDPSVGIAAADTSIDDGFVSGGFDVSSFDTGGFDTGVSAVEPAVGFDTGSFDVSSVDVGGFDTSGIGF